MSSIFDGNQIPIGVKPNGKILFEDIDDIGDLIIAGAKGTGKTIMMQNILLHLIRTNPIDNIIVLIYDQSESDWYTFSKEFSFSQTITHDEFEFTKQVKFLEDELYKRVEYYKKNHLKKFPVGGKHTTLKRIYFFVDEWVGSKEFRLYLDKVSLHGSQFGIHLIISCSDPSKRNLPDVLKVDFASRVAFYLQKQSYYDIVLGDPIKDDPKSDELYYNSKIGPVMKLKKIVSENVNGSR